MIESIFRLYRLRSLSDNHPVILEWSVSEMIESFLDSIAALQSDKWGCLYSLNDNHLVILEWSVSGMIESLTLLDSIAYAPE